MTTPHDHLTHPDKIISESPVVEERSARRAWLVRPSGSQLLVSVLIAVLGILASKALEVVDHDLRNMYTEYTLSATGLAHTSSALLRYRITVIRAIEAQNTKEFERMSASLVDQRRRILQAVERYEKAGQLVLQSGSPGYQDLHGFRQSLEAYFTAADQTLALILHLWNTKTASEAEALRHQAELLTADNTGPKLVQASDALERLLLGVAEVGKDMLDQGSGAIRVTSLTLVLGSLLIAALNILKS